MSPEAQLRAIAAALGWTDLWMAPVGDLRAEPQLLGRPKPSDSYWPVPDYLGDLNRACEFEKVIEDNALGHDYLCELHEAIWGKRCWKVSEADHFTCATATAAQRAKSFLRAMDLWVDSPEEKA